MTRAVSGSRFLIPRNVELTTLREKFAEAARGLPRFVLVEGEAGMGRTTLLDAFIAESDQAVILRASGDVLEARLHYGIVEQLCRTAGRPLPPVLATLAGPEAGSLPPHTVGASLLDVVGDLQARSPVVLVVDDTHLADEPSQHAILFALRRLRAEQILVVLSAPLEATARVAGGLLKLISTAAGTRVGLTGFDDEEVRRLGSLAGGSFTRSAARHLRDQTGGNPLHIRALLDEIGVKALERLGPAPPPPPGSFDLVVRERIAGCPEEARRLVGAVAVIGMQCELGLARRLASLEEPLAALQSAVDAGLVRFRERHVRFSHPLHRAAVYHALGVAERAELHRGAAALLDDTASRLRHLAAAATEEDGDLAEAVARFAGTEATRGAVDSAAALFQDASRLAPDGAARERHVLDAVECLLVGGEVAAARSLSVGLETYGDAGRAHCLLGRLAHLSGRPVDAEELLRRSLEVPPPSSWPLLAVDAAGELAEVHISALRPHRAEAWVHTVTRAVGGSTDLWRQLPRLALVLVLTGRTAEAIEIFSALPQRAEDSAGEASLLLGRSTARMHAAALVEARHDAVRLLRLTARRGETYLHVCGLAVLALTEYRLGAWRDSVAHAQRGVAITEETGLESPRSTLHAVAVWPLAGLGRWEEAEAHASSAKTASHTPWDQAMAAIARAALARARGRHGEVLDAVTALRALGPRDALDEPDGFWPWQELYIDACVATGHLEDAGTELDHFEQLATARASAGPMASAARLRGSLEMAQGRPEEAHTAFRRALSICPTLDEPYQHGLVHLAYGAYLRRIGARSAAEAELRIGRDHFERLGAPVWVETCEREMVASGIASARSRPAHPPALTPQENSVAALVTQGKTNRTVAAELMLSVNTVEYHLKNIYAKLGITSRSQLILRLEAGSQGRRNPD